MGQLLVCDAGAVSDPSSTITAVSPGAGSTFTVRGANNSTTQSLVGLARGGASAGIVRVRSPFLSDNVQGIRYAVSSDGKTWSKTAGSSCANLVSTGTSYDSTYIEWQQILKIGSYYELVYGSYSGSTWSTNIAYSTDPASGWQKSLANPIFSPSGGSNWDGTHVSTGAFYEIGGEWWLFYQGTDTGGFYGFGNWSMGMASLPNGNYPSAAIP